MNVTKTMLIHETKWNDQQSFRLIPIYVECPFLECIYDPTTKILAIISSTTKETTKMLPKLDDNGYPIKIKNSKEENNYKEERRIINTHHDYYIENMDDIKNFIDLVAINPQHESINILDNE